MTVLHSSVLDYSCEGSLYKCGSKPGVFRHLRSACLRTFLCALTSVVFLQGDFFLPDRIFVLTGAIESITVITLELKVLTRLSTGAEAGLVVTDSPG